jgi:hypothetical protein
MKDNPVIVREDELTSIVAYTLRSGEYILKLERLGAVEPTAEASAIDSTVSPFREIRNHPKAPEADEDTWDETWLEKEPGARGDIDVGT